MSEKSAVEIMNEQNPAEQMKRANEARNAKLLGTKSSEPKKAATKKGKPEE